MSSEEKTKSAAMAVAASKEEDGANEFEAMGLDPRLLRALAKSAIKKPTAVQEKCIPLALEGKDIVARAKTGSGKTLAYLLPLIHKRLADSLDRPSTETDNRALLHAVILVPTRELCQQVRDVIRSLAEYCGGAISVCQLTLGMTPSSMKAAMAASPDIIVTTPARFAQCLKEGLIAPAELQTQLETLVLDEADLLLSYGYEEDLRQIAALVPRRCQCMLMSATTSADVDRLKKLVLHNPAILTLTDVDGRDGGGGVSDTIQQFVINCKKRDKLLYTLALLKLRLLQKKVLMYVQTIDGGYRLKLFLEQFGIRSAFLNSEVPQNSRQHILQEFNRGLFDYLVATDDTKPGNVAGKGGEEGGENGGKQQKKKSKKKTLDDGEFGVSRGIDFKNVRTVVNVDLPATPSGYVHRIGRTGRAGETGVAISLATPEEANLMAEIEAAVAEDAVDDDVIDRKDAAASCAVIAPFPSLTTEAVENLRYRAEDVARGVTRIAVREARALELRMELLNSEKLKAHFEDNPKDFELLKHDKMLSKSQPAAHLKTLPSYLRDPATEAASRAVGLARAAMGSRKPERGLKRGRGREADPLRSLSNKRPRRYEPAGPEAEDGGHQRGRSFKGKEHSGRNFKGNFRGHKGGRMGGKKGGR